MAKISKLKEIDGAMWARLDIDWDGGPISLHTDHEIRQMKKAELHKIVKLLSLIENAHGLDVDDVIAYIENS